MGSGLAQWAVALQEPDDFDEAVEVVLAQEAGDLFVASGTTLEWDEPGEEV